jgi:hypothetical protein
MSIETHLGMRERERERELFRRRFQSDGRAAMKYVNMSVEYKCSFIFVKM